MGNAFKRKKFRQHRAVHTVLAWWDNLFVLKRLDVLISIVCTLALFGLKAWLSLHAGA